MSKWVIVSLCRVPFPTLLGNKPNFVLAILTISSLSYTKKLKAIILCARFSIAEADETVMVEIFAEKMLVVLSAIS